MSQSLLPSGCHDATSAAELLGMSKKALLRRMRELGWLMVGGQDHNLPRREYVKRGWLTTQPRGYCLKGKKEITKTYEVMLLTQTGFNALKTLLQNNPPATGATATEAEQAEKLPTANQRAPEARAVPVVTFNRYASEAEQKKATEAERQKCLEQLAEWGIAVGE